MKYKLVSLCVLSAALAASADIRAVTPTQWKNGKDGAPSWQLKRHMEKMETVANGGAKVVFIGDSITHFWESKGRAQLKKYFSEGDMKMLNLGTSADRTEHVLWRLREGGELDGYEAKFIHIMIGTNNTGHHDFSKEPPVDTILGVREILRTVREKQPKATIVLSSIFPRGEGPGDEKRRRNDIVNAEIRKFCDFKDVFWCDFSDDFLTDEGILPKETFPDRLHPAAQGYETWYAAIKPYLDYAFSDGAASAPVSRSSLHPTAATRPEGVARSAWPESLVCGDSGSRVWWLDRLLRNRNAIVSAKKGEIDLVFFGDSITHNWESKGKGAYDALSKKYSILNAGYAGDGVRHALWRAMYGELDGYKAKCVMLMIGTNDSRSSKPEETAEGVRKLLDTIAAKQPGATVLLLPVFPRGFSATDKDRLVNDKVNAIIKGFADGKKVVWVDFCGKFLDGAGSAKALFPDGVHPGAEGYRIWAEAVAPYFEKACGK